jgi:hypothetical protein
MKTINTLVIALVLLESLFLYSCSKSDPPGAEPVTSDAKTAAAEFWGKRITKCGDSAYTVMKDQGGGTLAILEFKNVSFTIIRSNSPISEADKLNGIEFKGTTLLVAKATRAFKTPMGFGQKQQWMEWANGAQDQGQDIYASIVKKKGRWVIEPGNYFATPTATFKAIKCSEIPSGG